MGFNKEKNNPNETNETFLGKKEQTQGCHHAKNTVHQVTTMLATSKDVLFPGHNHLPTTGADDPDTLTHW